MQTNKNFTIELKASTIEAFLLFAASKDFRYYLNSVALARGSIVATNGHKMLSAKVADLAKVDCEVVICRDILDSAIKTIRKTDRKKQNLKIEHFSGNVFVTTASGATFQKPAINARYPDFERVIPKNASANYTGKLPTFNAQHLLDVENAAQVIGKRRYNQIELTDEFNSALFNIENDAEKESQLTEIKAVIMPIRI